MVSAYTVLFVAAGLAMLGIAAWVLFQGPRRHLHRTFAILFAVGAGGAFEAGTNFLGVRWAPLFVYAYPFAAAVFVLAFRERYVGVTTSRLLPWGLGAAVIGLWTLQWRAPETFSDPEGIFDQGPLFFMAASFLATNAVVAAVLGRDALRAKNRTTRSASLTLSAAFACQGLVHLPLLVAGALGGEGLLSADDALSGHLRRLTELGAVVLVVCLVVVVVARTLRHDDPETRRLGVVYLVAAGLAATVLVAVSPIVERADPFDDFVATVGTAEAIVLFLLPVLAAHGTLRGRLFDAERRARRAVQTTTLAGILVAVSFVVSEAVAEFIGTRWGAYIGIGAAGLALVAYAPLHRLAARVATAAVPSARPLSAMDHDERIALLREQMLFAWGDGSLTRQERLRLESLRVRLGISTEDATAIEVAVAGDRPVSR